MGVVYTARDTHLDRRVAIKVLPADKVADAGRKQRFVHEAKSASQLNHPNIVTIYDIRSQEGIDFIVMELIEGQTIEELITPKGMRPPQALRYAVQIADALAKAHGAGILHRDLKPSNIMVTSEGRVKILDFGLAKLLEPEDTSPEATTVTARQFTEEGHVVGTAAYMSPEQAEGRKLDARSDIFSFGSVLYEMLTGRRPFVGESRLSILTKIVNEDPSPPAQVSTAIAPEFEKIILRCLRKDPARRYQTMADLKVALEDVEAESVSGKQIRKSLSWRWAWGGLVPALLLAGFLAWRASRGPGSTEPLFAVPLTTLGGVQGYPSFSPDGDYVAFTWTGPKHDNPDIYVQQIGAGSPSRRTTESGNDYNPVWSPDGLSIAFLHSQSEAGRNEVWLIPPLGGPGRKVADIRVRSGIWLTPPYLGWCPDSKCLVVTDSPGEDKPDALFVISLETRDRTQLTYPQQPLAGDSNPAVSPDGKWLVFRRDSTIFNGALHRLPLRKGPGASPVLTPAGEPQRLTHAAMDAIHPTWMPDSKEILFSAKGGLWRLAAAGDNPEETPARRLPFVGDDGLMPVVSRPQPGRPSRLVYFHSFMDDNLWRVDTSAAGAVAASPPVVAISSTRQDDMPQLSPDGRRVAFTSTRSGDWEIWVSDLDGSNAVKLTSMGARVSGYPHWSPDGDRIVFHSNPDGQPDVFWVPAAGGKPKNLSLNSANDAFPSYSRNGQWIYFTSNRSGQYRIWKMPSSGGDSVPVTNSVGYEPQESPDGAWLYYVEAMDKPSLLMRVPVSGGTPEKVIEGVILANFVVLKGGIYYIDRPSGEGGVYFLDRPSGETSLQYFDFASHKSTTVVRNLGKVGTPITATPDGRIVLYSREDSSVDDLMLVENFR